MKSSFHESIGQEIDTDWNQAREQPMEHILLLQDIGTPATNTMTQSGQLVPTYLLKQPESSKSTKPITNHVTEQIEAHIQKYIKYCNIQTSYTFKTTIIMFQIFLAVILILAVSYQYDVQKEPASLPTPPRSLPSHSSTCLQVEDSKNKQFIFQLCETLWVESLGYTSEQGNTNN